ncbi:leucine-rich repeat domain-containing protein [Peribacillus simplex]|uniref:leucine-rich repeat domain-containing protein n=1 Tax=Peribacillus simplex TaxID=1478 RepID=UPI00119F8B7F|nr:leucine-rich repeat domain-containing protein [Peribacillus simplex]
MTITKLNNILLRKSPGGDTVLVSSPNLPKEISFINENQITKVEINDYYYDLNEINFLSECPGIEQITINHFYLKDYSGIYNLKNLKTLDIGETEKNNILMLNELPFLESLYCYWTPKITGLNFQVNLQELLIWKYAPKERDLSVLFDLTKLKFLNLTQPKIDSLNGIQKLNNLEHVEVNNSRTLYNIETIKELKNSLKKLEINQCKNINNIHEIEHLINLEYLIFSDCGEVPSINFVGGLKNLNHFSFDGTTVLNGDLSPCIGIEYVNFTDKKHYSHSRKDFMYD